MAFGIQMEMKAGEALGLPPAGRSALFENSTSLLDSPRKEMVISGMNAVRRVRACCVYRMLVLPQAMRSGRQSS